MSRTLKWLLWIAFLTIACMAAQAENRKKNIALSRRFWTAQSTILSTSSFPPPKPCQRTSSNSRPTNGEFKGVRTFAQQIKHVAAVNYELAAAILEEKPPMDIGDESGPASVHVQSRHSQVSEGLFRIRPQSHRDDQRKQI